MLGCDKTITIVHHIKGQNGDTYECLTVPNCSWFAKTSIVTSGDGAKPANTYVVRIVPFLKDFTVQEGDYCVLGVVDNVTKPADLKGREYFRITAIGHNRRNGLLDHWRVSGQ